MDHLSIDLETFSSVPIQKAGAQKYIQSPDFEILLFAYSLNGAEPVCCDFAQGETLPKWVAEALLDPQCLNTHTMRPLSGAACHGIWAGSCHRRSGVAQCSTACMLAIQRAWMPQAERWACRRISAS